MRPFPMNWRVVFGLWAVMLLQSVLFSLPGDSVSAQQTMKEKERQTLLFVGDVLTKFEYADGSGGVTRWMKAPTISVFGDQDRHPPVVAATIREINSALPEDMQVKQLGDEDEKATIRIYFIRLEDFEEVALEHGFEIVSGNRGFFSVLWNAKSEIESAVVLIAEDKLSGRSLSHFVLEETTQVFGLVGDSSRFSSSVFYEDQARRKFGTTTRLSALDRKLIQFLYAHVPPGATAIEVGQLFERHW